MSFRDDHIASNIEERKVSMSLDRRTFLASSMALAATTSVAAKTKAATTKVAKTEAATSGSSFPSGFLWGAATAGHQVEGNNTASDTWFAENVRPTVFAEPSGDACNSLVLWPEDLDLVRSLGLNTYRFSIEWARIEPEQGLFSRAMLDHYARMIDGCRERGLTPIVTFNHFTCPRWFAIAGGWLNPKAPDLFARYCERAARHLVARIGYATTLNEPNLVWLLKWFGLPQQVWDAQRAMLEAAKRATGSDVFSMGNATNFEDLGRQLPILLAAHKAGRNAIKSVRPELPVGCSLAMSDDQAVGKNSRLEAKRAECYVAWLEAAKGDEVETGARRLALTCGLALELALAVEQASWSAARGDAHPAHAAQRLARRRVDLIDERSPAGDADEVHG